MPGSAEQAQSSLLGRLPFHASGRVPVGAFAGWAELGFSLTFGRPLVIASLTFPVPNSFLYLSHDADII